MTRVLFVCVLNSARSQMAEAFLNRLGEGRFTAQSAGLEPGTLNPYVVRAMQEIGYDLSGNQTKGVFDFYREAREYDLVIKVCDQSAGQRCPIFPSAKATLQWSFDDPSAFTGSDDEIMARVRRVRDDIKAQVEALITVMVMG